jgi:hypothetical protein
MGLAERAFFPAKRGHSTQGVSAGNIEIGVCYYEKTLRQAGLSLALFCLRQATILPWLGI